MSIENQLAPSNRWAFSSGGYLDADFVLGVEIRTMKFKNLKSHREKLYYLVSGSIGFSLGFGYGKAAKAGYKGLKAAAKAAAQATAKSTVRKAPQRLTKAKGGAYSNWDERITLYQPITFKDLDWGTITNISQGVELIAGQFGTSYYHLYAKRGPGRRKSHVGTFTSAGGQVSLGLSANAISGGTGILVPQDSCPRWLSSILENPT